jgi:DNA polymerase-1
MIVNCDVKALEVVTAAYLSQDKVMCQEIRDNVDIHENNRVRFNLPTRLIAKTFKFRLIYGGTAWAYALDSQFNTISTSPEFWQGIINEYYTKYEGLSEWHQYLVHEATTTGKVVCPTGRSFNYQPYQKNGDWVWPRTTILNYPVQGTGADLVSLARVEFSKQFKKEKINGVMVSSVHDSIVCDVSSEDTKQCGVLLKAAVQKIPELFQQTWDQEFNLPITAEISAGNNMKDLTILDI